MTDDADQSTEVEVEALPVADEAEADLPEVQTDEDGNPIEDDADLDEWTDDKGRVHKVPKALKEAELRQADYTRKTQELAAERKAVAAAQEQAAKLVALQQAVVAEQAELKAIEKSEAEWRAFQPRTQEEAEERRDRLDDLRMAREQTAYAMQQKAYHATQEATRYDEQSLKDMRAELPKHIPGYGKDPAKDAEIETQIATFAVREIGIPPEQVAAIRNPALIKGLYLARIGAEALAKQSAAKTVQAQQATAPAPQVGGKRAPPTGLDDRLSAEEWTRRRNEQIRKRGG